MGAEREGIGISVTQSRKDSRAGRTQSRKNSEPEGCKRQPPEHLPFGRRLGQAAVGRRRTEPASAGRGVLRFGPPGPGGGRSADRAAERDERVPALLSDPTHHPPRPRRPLRLFFFRVLMQTPVARMRPEQGHGPSRRSASEPPAPAPRVAFPRGASAADIGALVGRLSPRGGVRPGPRLCESDGSQRAYWQADQPNLSGWTRAVGILIHTHTQPQPRALSRSISPVTYPPPES